MVHQLMRAKKKSDDNHHDICRLDDDNNLYVTIDGGTITEVTNVSDVDSVNLVDTVTTVNKAVLYGTDQDGHENPLECNDEGVLSTARMADGSVITEGYVLLPANAPINTGVYADITNTDNERYDKYIVGILNTSIESTLNLSVQNTVTTSLADGNYYEEIATKTIPLSQAKLVSATAWSSCFTSINNVLTDESGDANDNVPPGGADVPFTFGAINDAIYFGDSYKFRGLIANVATAGVYTASGVWEYWNGAWTTLTINAGPGSSTTAPFKVLGTNSFVFEIPSDWVAYDIAGDPTSQYWIRFRITSFTSMTTGPAISQVQIQQVGYPGTYAYIIEGLFNFGDDIRLSFRNNTALTNSNPTLITYQVRKY